MIRPHLQFLLITFAGWVNRNQQDVIEYLRVENQVLREHAKEGRAARWLMERDYPDVGRAR